MTSRQLLGLCLLLLAPIGCVHMTVGMTAPVVKIASDSFHRESDVDLARDALPGQLKTVEGFLAADPENATLLEVTAQSYIEYAFGFLEDELDSMPEDSKHQEARQKLAARATALYDRALDYALQRLKKEDAKVPAAFRGNIESFEASLKSLKASATPAVFFAGLALASSINLNRNDIARVVDLPKATALIRRAYELNPAFYNSGPAMALGTILASQGKAMGGNPEQAKKYFDEAVARSGKNYLLIRVMMARYYAVVTQDRPLFEKLLRETVQAPADVDPNNRLPNELAKRRAARYLAHAEELF